MNEVIIELYDEARIFKRAGRTRISNFIYELRSINSKTVCIKIGTKPRTPLQRRTSKSNILEIEKRTIFSERVFSGFRYIGMNKTFPGSAIIGSTFLAQH